MYQVELTGRNEELREKSFKARIHYKDLLAEMAREKRLLKKPSSNANNNEGEDEDDEGENENGDDDEKNMLRINIKEIDDMLLRDLSNVVRGSTSKWPLLIDPGEQAATFLRYRDTNYVNCLDMHAMQPERFRLALIGAIRFGKPFVVDLMQYDAELLGALRTVCGQLDERLFDELCDKSLMNEQRYMRLVRLPGDGSEYEAHKFNGTRLANFRTLFLTSNPYPNEQLMALTLPIRIVPAAASGNYADEDF